MSDGLSARIIIVDDEMAQMRALCDTLSGHGYETVGFSSAKAALATLREAEFDLLLTDLMMPEMDGITLLQTALAVKPNLVGIIMTGEGTVTTAVEAMKTGALDYVLKPFKLSAILPVLARALAVRRLRVENAELTENVRIRTAELEVANKELEAFSYSVSHDLRGPLRAIDAYTKILLSDFLQQLPAEARQQLNKITRNAKRMEQLIDGLLRLSGLGRVTLSKKPINITALVHGVADELRNEQTNREIEIKISDMPDCVGDASLLRQVFVNLLSNAVKFTRQNENAVIEVGCRQQDMEHVYFVRDNGAGFDMEYAPRLFGVFQRFHTAEQFEGTGIGLSIVQRIVQRHDGRIWAEAATGEGATFHFAIPQIVEKPGTGTRHEPDTVPAKVSSGNS